MGRLIGIDDCLLFDFYITNSTMSSKTMKLELLQVSCIVGGTAWLASYIDRTNIKRNNTNQMPLIKKQKS